MEYVNRIRYRDKICCKESCYNTMHIDNQHLQTTFLYKSAVMVSYRAARNRPANDSDSSPISAAQPAGVP